MELKDVENLAELARIELSKEEKEGILKDMDSILEYVKTIESVEVEDIEPEYLVTNAWREDDLEKRDFSLELIKDQFPDQEEGFLKVKKIL